MITPLFSVTQTASTLELRIRAPHSRPRDIQLTAHSRDFHFYTSPYLLHLRFEHPVQLPDPPTSHYDLETGIATITLQKTAPYPHFTRLDMLSTLLVTRPATRTPPSIEVLSTTTSTALASEPAIAQLQATTASGLQVPLRELSLTRPGYGFALRHDSVFSSRAEDASQIVELPSPDTTPVWRRASLRKAAEDAKFCPDHYIADFLLAHEYEHVTRHYYAPPDVSVPLPHRFVNALLKLPRREYLQEVDVGAAADLAGILFAAAYDERVTLGERCVESPWTVSRLSATMAFLESFPRPRDAVLAAYRRSLAYPLYRSVALAELVLRDLKALFRAAEVDVLRSRLLRVLLELREVFEGDKLLRLHCDLFMVDYCVWIQKVDDAVLARLREDVLGVVIERHELEWDLDALEAKALRMANGEEVEEGPVSVGEKEMSGKDGDGAQATFAAKVPDSQVTISALSSLPMPGLKMEAVVTRKLNPGKKEEELFSDSSSYETDSSSYESSSMTS